MMEMIDIVRKQIEEEFESVVGDKLPDLGSSDTIVLHGRRFTDKTEYAYYLFNCMWDKFDEELTETEVDNG
jgi:hypothetical protein